MQAMISLKIRLLLVLTLALISLIGLQLLTAPALKAQDGGKITPQLSAQTANGEQTEFFILLADKADLSGAAHRRGKAKTRYVYEQLWATAQGSQGPLKRWLDQRGVSYRSFYIANALLVTGDQKLVQALAARPDVARLEANPSFRALMLPPKVLQRAVAEATGQGVESSLQYVHADDVWALGYTGQGIVVGGQDTGYEWDHPALIDHYRGWNGSSADHDYNWHDSIHVDNASCNGDSLEPCDDDSHGTHTMGTVVGDDGGSGGSNQIGMAPSAKWIGCRNMNQGNGTPASYLECFEFFLAPYPITGTAAQGVPELAPDVTVNSWSCPPSEGCSWETLQLAVEAQRAAGIMTVVAASNSGNGCSTVDSPAGIYDAAYSIGALNTGSDTLASFSSRGPVTVDGSGRLKPDISAPGTGIRSSTPGGSYGSKSGTSMAAPHVAGAVALLWSAVPSLTNDLAATEAALNQTAVPLSTTDCSSSGSPNNLFGYGRLDILAAVESVAASLIPQAGFTHTSALANFPVDFFETTTGVVLTSTWDFGDGAGLVITTSSLNPVQHTYPASGSYTVALTAANSFGASTLTQSLTVLPVQEVLYLPLLQK